MYSGYSIGSTCIYPIFLPSVTVQIDTIWTYFYFSSNHPVVSVVIWFEFHFIATLLIHTIVDHNNHHPQYYCNKVVNNTMSYMYVILYGCSWRTVLDVVEDLFVDDGIISFVFVPTLSYTSTSYIMSCLVQVISFDSFLCIKSIVSPFLLLFFLSLLSPKPNDIFLH